MSLMVSENENKTFAPVSEGLHPAICVGIYDIGAVYSQEYAKIQDKVVLTWELLDETVTNGEGKEIRRTISKEFTKSFNEKSTLRKMLKSWRGREFTPEELAGFNIGNVLLTPCQLQVTHTNKNDKTYANIDSIVSYPKGVAKPVPEAEPIAFDLDSEGWQADIEKLPEWIQNKIKASETYKSRVGGAAADDAPPAPTDEDVPF